MTSKPLKYVFMDESGNKESDRFFACGFLEIENPQEFLTHIRRIYDQIFNLSIRNRQARIEQLSGEGKIGEIAAMAKSFSRFELKHYTISNENQRLYRDLIKVLFKKTKFRYTTIVFDRNDPAYMRDENPHALHLKALKMYATCVIPENDTPRAPVIETLEGQLGQKIRGKLTKTVNGNYFSVWMVDFGKKKSESMDKKPNPRFQHEYTNTSYL